MFFDKWSKNSTIAEIDFKVKEDFFSITDITVTVDFAQNFADGKLGWFFCVSLTEI